MPQATTLRLVRGNRDTRRPVPVSALSLVQQHATHVRRVHVLASSLAADADMLIEALRYFAVAPPRKAAG